MSESTNTKKPNGINKKNRTHVPVEGHKIEELQQKNLQELIEIAKQMQVENPHEFPRRDLIFEILK